VEYLLLCVPIHNAILPYPLFLPRHHYSALFRTCLADSALSLWLRIFFLPCLPPNRSSWRKRKPRQVNIRIVSCSRYSCLEDQLFYAAFQIAFWDVPYHVVDSDHNFKLDIFKPSGVASGTRKLPKLYYAFLQSTYRNSRAGCNARSWRRLAKRR
jgi:hypothetical protein